MKCSFVLPSYNCVTFLPHAIQSCLSQTFKDIEVICVDDGSTDRTWEYLEWLEKQDFPVKVIRNIKNLGRSEARNIGNKAASGDIIMVLDADDLATPNRAEIMVKKFTVSKPDYVYGAATVIDALGRVAGEVKPDVFDEIKALETKQNRIVHSTAAYTNDFARKYPYPGGDLARLGLDDWAQQIYAKLNGTAFDFVPQKLACHRLLNSQITKTRDEMAVKTAKTAFLESLKVLA